MAVATHPPEQRTDSCDQCGDEYRIATAVRGFCSLDCFHRHKGANLLSEIKRDHRICATCFKFIKETDYPPEQWLEDAGSRVQTALDHGASIVSGRDGQLVLDATECEDNHRHTATEAVIGYQFSTEHATTGLHDLREDDPYTTHEVERLACTCGNVDTSHREEVLERVERGAVVIDLLRTLAVLAREGAAPSPPDKDVLFDTLREHGRDWELAIGRAIYA